MAAIASRSSRSRRDDPAVARALDELRYFTSMLTILGVYPADPLRARQQQG